MRPGNYPLTANHVCEFDFGPLEVVYDYDRIKQSMTKAVIQSRPKSMWRFRELLPVAGEPTVGLEVGGTPLIKADRLARRLGIRELWVKNDTVNYPTLSFKDRVVSVALSHSALLNWVSYDLVACALDLETLCQLRRRQRRRRRTQKAYVFIPSEPRAKQGR